MSGCNNKIFRGFLQNILLGGILLFCSTKPHHTPNFTTLRMDRIIPIQNIPIDILYTGSVQPYSSATVMPLSPIEMLGPLLAQNSIDALV
jgi:hypothetical protein